MLYGHKSPPPPKKEEKTPPMKLQGHVDLHAKHMEL